MAPLTEDSPYEKARKRLEKLSKDESIPKPPQEVLDLNSTRALDDWADLMLCQDPDLWGSIDLMIAAQLVCLQELCRDLQFKVQNLGQDKDMDRWGNEHPSVEFRQWYATQNQILKLRSTIGIQGAAVADASERRANKKAKKALERAGKSAGTVVPTPPPDSTEQSFTVPKLDDLKGTDLTA